MEPQAFAIHIPPSTLDDLHTRLSHTRWPDEIGEAGWAYGTNPAYLRELVSYWQHEFDWRKQETRLNQFHQYRATVDGQGLHFIHERGKGPNPTPLLLIHGWPDSFFRMYKLIPLLTDPAAHGGRAEDAFDVIVPSLPGYGFSDQPRQPGMNPEKIAGLFARLMTETLGYSRFAVHGGDWGSSIAEQLAFRHSDALTGLHLTDIPYNHLFTINPEELSPEEQDYLKAGQAWQMSEGAYAMIQSTKPQTLAYGLTDSPVGLLAWLLEKFQSWSDNDGNVESRFTKDELLTNTLIYCGQLAL